MLVEKYEPPKAGCKDLGKSCTHRRREACVVLCATGSLGLVLGTPETGLNEKNQGGWERTEALSVHTEPWFPSVACRNINRYSSMGALSTDPSDQHFRSQTLLGWSWAFEHSWEASTKKDFNVRCMLRICSQKMCSGQKTGKEKIPPDSGYWAICC